MRLAAAVALVVLGHLSGPLSAQTAGLNLYTPEQQAKMTAEGTIPTMTTPSELQELFRNAGKVPKPTGDISYCNAGLMGRGVRAKALQTIEKTCNGQYTIVRAVPLLDGINTSLGVQCNRSEMIIFRCDGAGVVE